MIVQCDHCKAKFNLADEKITDKGLKVRCSKCKTVFIAKKPPADSPAAPPPSPPTPAPPSSTTPPPPKPAGAEKADPFSDFTFSEDLDLDSKEDTNSGPPVSTERAPATPSHQDYAPTAVPAPAKPAPPPPARGEADEQFNFADEDFAQPAPPTPPPKPAAPKAAPPKPAPPKPAPPKAAPPPGPPAKGKAAGSTDDVEFGDFNFDEESFAEPQEPPAKAAPPAEDWGSASTPPETPKASPRKAAPKPTADEEESFGDFHFDTDGSISAGAPEAGGGDDLGDFVRSATSKAPVQDELEASLESDTESEPAPAPRLAAAAAAATPAKPVIRHVVKDRSWTPLILVGVLLLFLAAIGGGIGFLHVTGRFTLKDLMAGDFTKIKQMPEVKQFLIRMGWMEPPDTGTVEVLPRTRDDAFFLTRNGVDLLVVKGTVRNTRRKPQSFFQVEVTLKDKEGNVLATHRGYCDVAFTKDELISLSRDVIEDFMNARTGRNFQNQNVKQNEARDFMVVFYPVPAGVNNAEVRMAGYMDSEEAADLLRKGEANKAPEAPKSPEQPGPSGGATPP